MSNDVFVDTAGWVALLHRGDALHERAVAVYQQLITDGYALVTSSLVLVEVASAFAVARLRHLAIELERRYQATTIGQLVWVDETLSERGWELYRARPDKHWSLVDCVSFVIMQDRNIILALTEDHHFEQAGFSKLL